MLAIVLFWAFTLCILVQCGYVCYFFIDAFSWPASNVHKRADSQVEFKLRRELPSLSMNNLAKNQHKVTDVPVSVIICARNEAENLKKNLPVIFAQRYENAAGESNFEVIVVNDCSTDESAAVLQDFQKRYRGLKVLTIRPDDERILPGKKFPLSRGVEVAKNDFLLLTDADCMPASNFWMSEMMIPLWVSGNHGQIVGGYGKLAAEEGLLNAFSRWETMHTFLQYRSYARRGLPYMVVGRNLACRKSALLSAQQSPLWKEMPSGDDDLLVRLTKDADQYNDPRTVQIFSNPDAFTISDAKRNWRDWLKQKQRHVSTGKLYQPKIQALLGAYALSHTLTWLLPMALAFTPLAIPAFIMLLARCLLYWVVWARAASGLQERNLIYYFPFFDFGWMVYNFALSPFIFWKNKQQWK